MIRYKRLISHSLKCQHRSSISQTPYLYQNQFKTQFILNRALSSNNRNKKFTLDNLLNESSAKYSNRKILDAFKTSLEDNKLISPSTYISLIKLLIKRDDINKIYELLALIDRHHTLNNDTSSEFTRKSLSYTLIFESITGLVSAGRHKEGLQLWSKMNQSSKFITTNRTLSTLLYTIASDPYCNPDASFIKKMYSIVQQQQRNSIAHNSDPSLTQYILILQLLQKSINCSFYRHPTDASNDEMFLSYTNYCTAVSEVQTVWTDVQQVILNITVQTNTNSNNAHIEELLMLYSAYLSCQLSAYMRYNQYYTSPLTTTSRAYPTDLNTPKPKPKHIYELNEIKVVYDSILSYIEEMGTIHTTPQSTTTHTMSHTATPTSTSAPVAPVSSEVGGSTPTGSSTFSSPKSSNKIIEYKESHIIQLLIDYFSYLHLLQHNDFACICLQEYLSLMKTTETSHSGHFSASSSVSVFYDPKTIASMLSACIHNTRYPVSVPIIDSNTTDSNTADETATTNSCAGDAAKTSAATTPSYLSRILYNGVFNISSDSSSAPPDTDPTTTPPTSSTAYPTVKYQDIKAVNIYGQRLVDLATSHHTDLVASGSTAPLSAYLSNQFYVNWISAYLPGDMHLIKHVFPTSSSYAAYYHYMQSLPAEMKKGHNSDLYYSWQEVYIEARSILENSVPVSEGVIDEASHTYALVNLLTRFDLKDALYEATSIWRYYLTNRGTRDSSSSIYTYNTMSKLLYAHVLWGSHTQLAAILRDIDRVTKKLESTKGHNYDLFLSTSSNRTAYNSKITDDDNKKSILYLHRIRFLANTRLNRYIPALNIFKHLRYNNDKIYNISYTWLLNALYFSSPSGGDEDTWEAVINPTHTIHNILHMMYDDGLNITSHILNKFIQLYCKAIQISATRIHTAYTNWQRAEEQYGSDNRLKKPASSAGSGSGSGSYDEGIDVYLDDMNNLISLLCIPASCSSNSNTSSNRTSSASGGGSGEVERERLIVTGVGGKGGGGYLGHKPIPLTAFNIKYLMKAYSIAAYAKDKYINLAQIKLKELSHNYDLPLTSIMYEPFIYYYTTRKLDLEKTEETYINMINNTAVGCIPPTTTLCISWYALGMLRSGQPVEALDFIQDEYNMYKVLFIYITISL